MILIKNGYLIDPANERNGRFDLLLKNDKVKKVKENILTEEIKEEYKEAADNLQIIDAQGKHVMPGFIDLHIHLREPGFEYKETVETGTKSAAAGGFTTVCAMPNTNPPMDTPERIQKFLDIIEKDGLVNVLPVASITREMDGNQLTDIKTMARMGAVAVSEDGKSVMDTYVYAQGMKAAALEDIPVLAHCEDTDLVRGGVLNAGKKAEELNMPGITNAVEDVIVARDILLAKENGARLHLCHCSTKDSAVMIKMAKDAGLKVTGEICPHHFILTDEDIPKDDANYKMNPPLRSREDVEALKIALRDGVIDAIATDHAPHSLEEKKQSIRTAPFGIVGLETAFSLSFTELVNKDILTLDQMVEKLSVNPAKIINIDRGSLQEGKIADITIADINEEYNIDKNEFLSKSNNTPFHRRKVQGRITHTIVSGQLVYQYKNEVKKND